MRWIGIAYASVTDSSSSKPRQDYRSSKRIADSASLVKGHCKERFCSCTQVHTECFRHNTQIAPQLRCEVMLGMTTWRSGVLGACRLAVLLEAGLLLSLSITAAAALMTYKFATLNEQSRRKFFRRGVTHLAIYLTCLHAEFNFVERLFQMCTERYRDSSEAHSLSVLADIRTWRPTPCEHET
jgi:hypothetical protein